jgi:exodeoxyribonuclease VII large subunit
MKQVEISFEAAAAAVQKPRVITVTEAVRAAARALEVRFADVWIEGEISNFKRHSSGHFYFSLKDEGAQLSCAMFRAQSSRLPFAPADGLKVRCRGKLSIFEQQGKFQMYVQAMEPAGLGAAQLALEQLKQKLAAEGLFATARKRPLPRTPRVIGVVTSPTGAAVRDIIRVLHRRAAVRVIVAPTLVQGPDAPASIARALGLLCQHPAVEVVIIGRGGGSSEDLSAFNDERVVRAVAGTRVPIISAVGHEVDVTLCDFAADVRAPTPSGAAELAAPVDDDLREAMLAVQQRLRRALARVLEQKRVQLERASALLGMRRVTQDRRQLLDDLSARLRALHPRERLARNAAQLERFHHRLAARMHALLAARRSLLAGKMAKLDAMSPLRVLDRGYAIACLPTGHAVRSAAELADGDRLDLRLARGAAVCVVESTRGET